MINLRNRLIDIENESVRDNFILLIEEMNKISFNKFDGKHRVYEFTGVETNKKIPHGLGFKPVDVLQTSLRGAGAITFNYDLFDETNINITTTGACTVRLILGRFQ